MPWGLVSFGAVWSGDVEEELVGRGLLRSTLDKFFEEVLSVFEGFDGEELIFDESVDSFYVGLPGVGAWGYGCVFVARYAFNGFGEG